MAVKSDMQLGERLEDSINLTFTRREVLFLDLCLRLVARDHARNGTVCSDLEMLRDRLVDGSRMIGIKVR